MGQRSQLAGQPAEKVKKVTVQEVGNDRRKGRKGFMVEMERASREKLKLVEALRRVQ